MSNYNTIYEFVRTELDEDAKVWVNTLQRLGFWTKDYQAVPKTSRTPFPENISSLGPNDLSDLNARLGAEGGRLDEVEGYLKGRLLFYADVLELEQVKARNSVRRKEAEDAKKEERAVKKFTAAEIKDLTEVLPSVREAKLRKITVESLLASVSAAKASNTQYLAVVSREITARGDMLRARM